MPLQVLNAQNAGLVHGQEHMERALLDTAEVVEMENGLRSLGQHPVVNALAAELVHGHRRRQQVPLFNVIVVESVHGHQ